MGRSQRLSQTRSVKASPATLGEDPRNLVCAWLLGDARGQIGLQSRRVQAARGFWREILTFCGSRPSPLLARLNLDEVVKAAPPQALEVRMQELRPFQDAEHPLHVRDRR